MSYLKAALNWNRLKAVLARPWRGGKTALRRCDSRFIRRRSLRWVAGLHEEVWLETVRLFGKKCKTKQRVTRKGRHQRRKARRAIRTTQLGDLSGASKSLLSHGLADLSDEKVIQQLRDKHPKRRDFISMPTVERVNELRALVPNCPIPPEPIGAP